MPGLFVVESTRSPMFSHRRKVLCLSFLFDVLEYIVLSGGLHRRLLRENCEQEEIVASK
jgi:hypothetical protein